MRLRLLATLAVAALVLACGGDDGGSRRSSGDGTPTATVDFQQAAQDAVQDALLTADDLPAGWSELLDGDDGEETQAPDEDALDAEFEQQFRRCSGIEDENEDFVGQVAAAESPDFEPEDGAESVNVETYAFSTDDEAKDALDIFGQAFNDCRDVFSTFMTRYMEQQLQADPETSGLGFEVESSLEERSTLKLGDGSRDFRLEVAVEAAPLTLEFNFDFMMVRQGRMAGLLFYFTAREGGALGRIATAFADKLYRADLALPETDDD